MTEPYWTDEDAGIRLYLGDMRQLLPELNLQADCIVTDPPYQETALVWDRWPDGWPTLAATVARSMWCFGSMRMFLDRGHEITAAGWKLSQDYVWEKHNGTGFATDRFRRVHETATHWYLGDWATVHHKTPRVPAQFDAKGRTQSMSAVVVPHTGAIGAHAYTDTGTRLARSVRRCPSVRRGIHPTQKPTEIVRELIEYACPSGGTVLDPFAGSGSTLDAARQAGRRAIGIEADERYAEAAVRRLSALTLPAA